MRKLFQKIRSAVNRKKKRVTKNERQISPRMTVAEKLIHNNWNIRFNNTPPARAGQKRAAQREYNRRKLLKIDRQSLSDQPPSRQILRAEDRRMWKNLRSRKRMYS